jgi:predicted HTH domain antitoxin
MRTLVIKLPDTIDLNQKEVVMVLAARLYEMGKLSLGQAADLAGYSKATFMELLGGYGVSVFNYPVDDLDKDIQHAKDYHS